MSNTTRSLRTSARVFAAFSLLVLAVPASAHDYTLGALRIAHPWARATPGGAKIGGGFMAITNTGKEADRLLGGSAEIARSVELHVMTMDGAMMRMRALDNGLEIKPGETVKFKPGGYHVMFIELSQPLREGETIKGALVFEKAGRIEVEFKVEGRGAAGDANHGAHQPGHGGMKQ